MLIKRITLRNFRQFKGTQCINLSCDPEKNVTILLGDNTFGKTTLLQAFNWALYGQADFPAEDNPDFLLNLEYANEIAGNEKRADVYVEITLEHKKTEYIIKRKQEYNDRELNDWRLLNDELIVSFKDENGVEKSAIKGEEQNVINGILPKGLSSYFFFDTERVSNMEKKDLADSVKGLLGLTAISNTRNHLGNKSVSGSVIGRWYSLLNGDGDEEVKLANETIRQEEQNIADLNENIELAKKELKRLNDSKQKIDNILIENKNTTELQEAKQLKEQEKDSERKDLSNKTDLFFKNFSKNFVSYLMIPLFDQAEQCLKESNVDDKGIRDLTETAILEIIKRGRCNGGAEIIPRYENHPGNNAYNQLIEELKYVPPAHLGTAIRNYKDLISSERRNISDFYDNAEQQNKDIQKSINKINSLEREITKIDESLFDKEDMKTYENDLRIIKEQISRFENNVDKYNQEKGVAQSKIESATKKRDSLVKITENNNKLIRLIAYAEAICKHIDDTYNLKEKELREIFQHKVNEIFNKIYHGERQVVINKDYTATLLANLNGKEIITSESEGLKRVKNFAFIASLVDIAKDKASKTNSKADDIYREYEAYPLVMDAPFSNTDENHIKKISNVLPNIANQVIMFVMEKDWKYAKIEIENKVGMSYRLNKHTETFTTIDN